MGTGELSGKPDEILGGSLRGTSIPSRRSRNTPSQPFNWLRKPGYASAVWATRLVCRLSAYLSYHCKQYGLYHALNFRRLLWLVPFPERCQNFNWCHLDVIREFSNLSEIRAHFYQDI